MPGVIAFQQPTQASLVGSLQFTAQIGNQILDAASLGSSPTLGLSSANVLAGPAFIVGTGNSAFQEIDQFQNLPASGLLTAFERTGQALEELSPSLDINSALGGFGYTSSQASDIVDLKKTFSSITRSLMDPLVTASNRLPWAVR